MSNVRRDRWANAFGYRKVDPRLRPDYERSRYGSELLWKRHPNVEMKHGDDALFPRHERDLCRCNAPVFWKMHGLPYPFRRKRFSDYERELSSGNNGPEER